MKNIINKIVKSPLLIIVVVVVIISCIGTSYALGPYLYNSNEINYDNTESGLQSDNVQDAVDELFQHATDYTSMDSRVSELEGIIIDNASDNAGFHNSIFRGKNLGTSVTEAQWTAISSGTFKDLYVGDYWVINNVTWRIAGFDIYYGKGDIAFNTHHAVIVPDTILALAQMNSSNTTEGGYVGSAMYTTTLPSVLTTIRNAFGTDHVLKYRALLTNSVNTSATNRYPGKTGASDGWGWYDAYVNLMNMVQVTGNMGFSSSGFDTGADNIQFPLFRLKPEFVNKARIWYWVRDVSSSAFFACVSNYGNSYSDASNSGDVRPYFYIG